MTFHQVAHSTFQLLFLDTPPFFCFSRSIHCNIQPKTNSSTIRQLIGRVARQGDPGSYRKILCLSDDLLDEAFTTAVAEAVRKKMRASFSIPRCLDLFNKAQRIVSEKKRVQRKSLFYNDKKNLKYLHQAGLDPILDLPG